MCANTLAAPAKNAIPLVIRSSAELVKNEKMPQEREMTGKTASQSGSSSGSRPNRNIIVILVARCSSRCCFLFPRLAV